MKTGSLSNVLYPGDILTKKSIFNDCEKNWLYCGKINGKRLLYCAKKKEHILVDSDFVKGQTGRLKSSIIIIKQTDKQFEFHKNVAKGIKRRWLEKHGQNSNRD